jgi:adenylate kinase family enzyme
MVTMIVGSTGAGKTTYSRKLGSIRIVQLKIVQP